MTFEVSIISLCKDPQYVEAIAVLDKLTAALKLEKEVEVDCNARLNLLCVAPGQKMDEVERAVSMADGNPAPAGIDALSRAIRDSQGKQSILKSGIEGQEQRLADLAGTLSLEYCQGRRADHLAILDKLRKGLEQVRDAVECEGALRESINAAGYRDMLPGLHQLTFRYDTPEAGYVREINHYVAIHDGSLSQSRQISGIALSNFNMFGVSGAAGQPLTVPEVTGELLRYHGKFDPNTKALKQSRSQQLTEAVA